MGGEAGQILYYTTKKGRGIPLGKMTGGVDAFVGLCFVLFCFSFDIASQCQAQADLNL